MAGSVLVGLDGTEHSMSAVHWGAEEAVVRNLPLHLLHSWASQHCSGAPAPTEADRRSYGTVVLGQAEAAVRARHPEVPVAAEQVGEEAADALADRSGAATLLVLGSRGHDAISGFLLGSVSLRVLGRAECPVVTVREEKSEEGSPVGPGHEVVVGVPELSNEGDPVDPADPVLDHAFTTAAAHRAGLRAVRARTPADILCAEAARRLGGPAPVDDRELLAAGLAPWRERFPDVEVIEQVADGRVVPVLLAACSRAGLLVIGRRPQRTPMPLGPAVLAVLHHSRCPVAVVPRG